MTADLPELRGLAFRRALRAERQAWRHAAGAVLTTPAQARALAAHFPQLPILVRPNGTTLEQKSVENLSSAQAGDCLRLGHFGNFYRARLDIAPFLDSLALSGLWESVELHQYGQDWTNALAGVRVARVVPHDPLPWPDVVARAPELDAALVVGNRDRKQLPSKAVDYLTLPIPRIAVTRSDGDDALVEYVADKPGWLVLAPDIHDAPDRVRAHVSRLWSEQDLALPASEQWGVVAKDVADFARHRLLGRPPL